MAETAIVTKPDDGSLVLMRAPNAESKTLFKQTSSGLVQAMKTEVVLSDVAKHTYVLKGKRKISAAGYNHINKAMGVSPRIPEFSIGEDGRKQGNPYIYHDEFGAVKGIKIRMAGIGRNAAGNQMIVESVLHYDLAPMIAGDYLAKWRPKNSAHKKWGKLYPAENEAGIPKDRKKIRIPGGYILAVEIEGEVHDLIADHNRLIQFATRKAQTIVWRNILKVFVGQEELGDSNGTNWSVSVIAWSQTDHESLGGIDEILQRARGEQIVISQAETVSEHDADTMSCGSEATETETTLEDELPEDVAPFDPAKIAAEPDNGEPFDAIDEASRHVVDRYTPVGDPAPVEALAGHVPDDDDVAQSEYFDKVDAEPASDEYFDPAKVYPQDPRLAEGGKIDPTTIPGVTEGVDVARLMGTRIQKMHEQIGELLAGMKEDLGSSVMENLGFHETQDILDCVDEARLITLGKKLKEEKDALA